MDQIAVISSGLSHAARRIAVAVVRGYQLLISPLIGPRCRFYPTCSEYMILSVQKFGVWKGVAKGIWRLLKCHTLYRGDPVDFP